MKRQSACDLSLYGLWYGYLAIELGSAELTVLLCKEKRRSDESIFQFHFSSGNMVQKERESPRMEA